MNTIAGDSSKPQLLLSSSETSSPLAFPPGSSTCPACQAVPAHQHSPNQSLTFFMLTSSQQMVLGTEANRKAGQKVSGHFHLRGWVRQTLCQFSLAGIDQKAKASGRSVAGHKAARPSQSRAGNISSAPMFPPPTHPPMAILTGQAWER